MTKKVLGKKKKGVLILSYDFERLQFYRTLLDRCVQFQLAVYEMIFCKISKDKNFKNSWNNHKEIKMTSNIVFFT